MVLDWLGLGKVVSNVATEIIETDMDKAEARSVGIKAIDPNGQMRRELARFASIAFGFYLLNCVFLGYMVAFDLGNTEGAKEALSFMGELFLPVLGSWTGIVSASFGVNITNNWKDVKLKGIDGKQ
jgi:hypothetical protein